MKHACALLFGGFFERGVIHVYKVVSIAYFNPLDKKNDNDFAPTVNIKSKWKLSRGRSVA